MHATLEGTRRFAESQPADRQASYRQTVDGWWVSSLGVGTYLGAPDDATDILYRAAFTRAVSMGCNVFDCAINYRHQRSEKALGSWLAQSLASGTVQRDELVICTKGGFVPYDGHIPDDAKAYVRSQFVEGAHIPEDTFAADLGHNLSPAFLELMIATSLRNLALDTIDVYYLHNPETQQIGAQRQTFHRRMIDAFEALEAAVDKGQIASYGLATWTAFRGLTNAPDYVSLTEMVSLAMQVAGDQHHFRYLQLPYNLFMTEAYAAENQQVGEAFFSPIAAAEELGLTVITSAPLYQGRLASTPVEALKNYLPNFSTDAQRAIQFARSTPGVTTTLVGMKSVEHVRENLSVLDQLPADAKTINAMFKWDVCD